MQKNLGVAANITEVDRSSTFGEKQDTVEPLEEKRGWLVDCAKDGLTVARKLFHQIAD